MNKENLLLYAITDRTWVGNYTLLQQIEQALQGGVTLLQLREKHLGEAKFIEEAIQVKKICEKYHVPLIINDNVDVAIKSGADGVHVGVEDMAIDEIRQKVGKNFIIGATAKTIEQAQGAEARGADYLGVGAVFPSPTKNHAIRITKEQLSAITSSVSIPSVAIGGITFDNMSDLEGGNMCGVAVVSAIFGADDIINTCRKLKERAITIIKR